MNFAESIRSAIDLIRGIPTDLGLRLYAVTVRRTSWSGARIGLGTATTTDVRLRVGEGNPHVALVSERDVVASGGLLESTDLRVGPMTPGMVDLATVDPTVSARQEVSWILSREGIDSTYRALSRDVVSATRHFVVLRKVGT